MADKPFSGTIVDLVGIVFLKNGRRVDIRADLQGKPERFTLASSQNTEVEVGMATITDDTFIWQPKACTMRHGPTSDGYAYYVEVDQFQKDPTLAIVVFQNLLGENTSDSDHKLQSVLPVHLAPRYEGPLKVGKSIEFRVPISKQEKPQL